MHIRTQLIMWCSCEIHLLVSINPIILIKSSFYRCAVLCCRFMRVTVYKCVYLNPVDRFMTDGPHLVPELLNGAIMRVSNPSQIPFNSQSNLIFIPQLPNLHSNPSSPPLSHHHNTLLTHRCTDHDRRPQVPKFSNSTYFAVWLGHGQWGWPGAEGAFDWPSQIIP